MLASVLAAHLIALWAFLQIDTLRGVVVEVAPIAVRIISPAAKAAAQPVPVRPVPVPQLPMPAVLHIAPPELPAAVPVVVTPPEIQPAPQPQPIAPAALAQAVIEPAPPAPQPAATRPAAPLAADAAPRTLPASAVQYLVPPKLVYPRASRRLGETGRVLVRVFISEAGLPERVLLDKSSGFPLLDEAALAAVRLARFKPYSENGSPRSGWAVVPMSFDLES